MKNYSKLFTLLLTLCVVCYSCSEDPVTPPTEICDNGIDDDGDGTIDCADGDCATNSACIEICDNGIDDDGDGEIDCADGDCATTVPCVDDCNNAIDDDMDGKIDCFDTTDCSTYSEAIYLGSFVGNYEISVSVGGIPITQPLNNADTVTITGGTSASDNELLVSSTVLNASDVSGTITACATLDMVNGYVIDTLPVTANDTFFGVAFGDSSIITITEDINTIFVNFKDMSVANGTKNVFPFTLATYPINNMTISSNSAGSTRLQ